MDAAELLERYLSGKSEGSRKVYRSEIARFLDFLEGRGRPVDQVTAADLDAYHRARTADGAAAKTLKRAFSMIKGFLALVEKTAGDYRSPVAERGTLTKYSAPSYAETEAFQNTLAAYGEWLAAENTRRAYTGAVGRFFRTVGKPPEEITHDDLMTWRRELQENGRLKAATMGLYLSALSRFGRFLRYKGRPTMPADFLTREALGVPKRSRRKGRPDHLTEDEFKAFFGAMRKAARSSTIAARDLALFGMVYAFGLRAGEAADAMGRHFGLKSEGARLVIEGRKHQRDATTTLDLTEARDLKHVHPLRDWTRRARTAETDPLICRVRWDRRARAHEILRGHGLTVRAIEYRFREWIEAAGIEAGAGRRLVVHSLRHTRATELVRRWDVVTVRDFLGHSSIAETDNYLH
jgi:site-specific recombinase XerD